MDHHSAWTWLSPPLPVMQILVLFFGRRLSKVHLGYLSLILEKEPIKCQEYESWAFFTCCYRAVNLKTEMPGDPSTEKPSGCRSRYPGSPGIILFGNFSYSWSANKTQYHPSQRHNSGKSFNCSVFTFPSFTATIVHRHSVFSIIQQPISSEDQHSWFFWIGNFRGKLILQHHPMNRWHSSGLWAVLLSPEKQQEYGFIPTNKTTTTTNNNN